MIKKCAICGKQFDDDTNRETCSSTCRGQLIKIRREAKLNQNRENEKLDPNKCKGGKYERVCEICGETFHTSSKVRKICYIPHTSKCIICGKEFPVDVYYPASTCSSKCASEYRARLSIEKYGVRSNFQLESNKEKAKKTCLEKYGVENPMSSKEVQDKICKINQEKYGVNWSVQRKDVKDKIKQTNLERYGVEWSCASEQAKQKTIQTNIERRGVEYVFQDPEFQANARKSCLDKYGTEYYTQSEDFKDKSRRTWIENYGVDNPLKSKEIQKRAEETSLEKYGTRRPQQNPELRAKITNTFIQNRANSIPDEQARLEYLKFKKDPGKYVKDCLNHKMHPSVIGDSLGYSDGTMILNIINECGLNNEYLQTMPVMEQIITHFIESIDTNIRIVHHDRKVLDDGKEIDIYLPDYKLGIECNPTATHNSSVSFGDIIGVDSTFTISSNYHRDKTNNAINNGIFLFHVFGYEWKYRPEVIKSMVRNLLGKNQKKLYARNLIIKDVPYEESTYFQDKNHRQGSSNASINLGLYTTSDELVSLMTFGNTRRGMGHRNEDNNSVFELIRFCNKLNTTVVGGASKLFSYFVNNYEFSKIISFSDRAHTKGNLYEKLNFHQVSITDPNYVWVNLNTDLYFNRVSCQKKNLRKLFKDETIDIENKTEQQIMMEHGFVQVFDSGNIRWEYTR